MQSAPGSTNDEAGADILLDEIVLPAVIRPGVTRRSVSENLSGAAMILLGTFAFAVAPHTDVHPRFIYMVAGLGLAAGGVVQLVMLWTSTLHLDADGFSYDVLGMRRRRIWAEVQSVGTVTRRQSLLRPGVAVVVPPSPTSGRQRWVVIPDIFSMGRHDVILVMSRLHAASIRTEL